MIRQITHAPHGHILTNTAVWSPDGEWIVYDVRSDAAGSTFDGDRIERVNVQSGEVQLLYRSRNGAKCGVATYHPFEEKILFILGPEHPTPDWQYAPNHRQGVILETARPGIITRLDARDLTPPFTPGALRGGSHVHVFSPDGQRVSFTYNDAVIHPDQRNVGVSIPRPVCVSKAHPRNHDADYFSVLISRTAADPVPGSDQIRRAFEDAWITPNSIAFIGEVINEQGMPIHELFVADLPENLTLPGASPLQGTTNSLPAPPTGVTQRRLTRTSAGLASPRHWPRPSPGCDAIAFLMKDDAGITQLWLISPRGGQPRQLSRNSHPIASAFSWSPDGRSIAHAMDGSVCITDAQSGQTHGLSDRINPDHLRPEACVFSPDGRKIACTQTVNGFNQIYVVEVPHLFSPKSA